MYCRECGIEFEESDPLDDELCSGCREGLYAEDDDPYDGAALAGDSPFPEFDWAAEWLE